MPEHPNNNGGKEFPPQSGNLGRRIAVKYRGQRATGTIVRDDLEEPKIMIIKLFDGRKVMGNEVDPEFLSEQIEQIEGRRIANQVQGQVDTLRHHSRALRRVVSAVVVVLLLFLVGWRADAVRRCDSANRFRTETLPTAFDEYTQFLGNQFGAPTERVTAAQRDWDRQMHQIFPARDCRFFSIS